MSKSVKEKLNNIAKNNFGNPDPAMQEFINSKDTIADILLEKNKDKRKKLLKVLLKKMKMI